MHGGVERLSFFSGKAEAIQAGGYNTSQEFGLDLKTCLFGTNNSFGIPYEVVLNLDALKNREQSLSSKISVEYTSRNNEELISL